MKSNNLCIDLCTTRCHGCFTEIMLEEFTFQEEFRNKFPLALNCSFVILKTVYMRQVVRQMLIIRQRVHSKDYWVKVLVPVVFF